MKGRQQNLVSAIAFATAMTVSGAAMAAPPSFELSDVSVQKPSAAGVTAPAIDFTFTNSTGGDPEAQGVEFDITYDDTRLTLNSQSITFPGAFTAICNDATAGTISCLAANASGALNDASGTIVFDVDSSVTPPDTIPVQFANVQYDTSGATGQTDATTTDGEVQVTAGPQPAASVSPDPVAFGSVTVGGSDTISYTVTNSGDSGSSLDIATVSFSGDTEFGLSNNNCDGQSLAQGASCSVDVNFSPSAATAYSGTITVDSNVADVTTSVTGSGAAATASFQSSPGAGSTITLRPSTGGEGQPASQTIQFSNAGASGTSVTGSCTTSSSSGPFTPASFGFGPLDGGESSSQAISCTTEASTFSGTLSCAIDETDSENNTTTSNVTYDLDCATRPLIIPTMDRLGLILMSMLIGMMGLAAFRLRR